MIERDRQRPGSWNLLVRRHWIGIGAIGVAGVIGVHVASIAFSLPTGVGIVVPVVGQWLILLAVLARAGVMIRRRSAASGAGVDPAGLAGLAASPPEQTRAFAELRAIVCGRLVRGLPVSRRRIGNAVRECLRVGGRDFVAGLDHAYADRLSATRGSTPAEHRVMGQEARIGIARRVVVLGLVLLLTWWHVSVGVSMIGLGIEAASATIDSRPQQGLSYAMPTMHAAFLAILFTFAPLELFPTGELSAEATPRGVRVQRLLGWSTFGPENSVRVIVADQPQAGLVLDEADRRGLPLGLLLLSSSGDMATLGFTAPVMKSAAEFLSIARGATGTGAIGPGERSGTSV